jgi:hypothetical protein
MLGGLVGKPVGGLIGGLFGDSGQAIGETIGGVTGSLGGTFLPFSAGPQLALAGAGPSASGNGQQAILLPQSVVPPGVKTALTFENSVLKGAAQEAVAAVERAVNGMDGSNSDQISEFDALKDRARQFLDAGDYARALAQAYLALNAVEHARRTAGQGSDS